MKADVVDGGSEQPAVERQAGRL